MCSAGNVCGANNVCEAGVLDLEATLQPQTFSDDNGLFANFDKNYGVDMNFNWKIDSKIPKSRVELKFDNFDVHTSDEVTVYDGPDANSPVLGTFTGTTLPDALASTGTTLFVTFVADGATTGKGFQGSFTQIPPPPTAAPTPSPVEPGIGSLNLVDSGDSTVDVIVLSSVIAVPVLAIAAFLYKVRKRDHGYNGHYNTKQSPMAYPVVNGPPNGGNGYYPPQPQQGYNNNGYW